MKINKNVDIIRDNNKDYLRTNSENRLIKQLVGTSAEAVYSFPILFGKKVDKDTVDEMQGTYWLRVPNSDNEQYDENVEIVTL